MLIDTSSKDSLSVGLSRCLHIPVCALEKKLLEAKRSAKEQLYFDTDVFNEMMGELIQMCGPESVDKVSFYHMSRRLRGGSKI